MSEAALQGGEHLPTLDVCTRCELVWFDPKEYEAFPHHPPPPPEPELPPEGREILAIEQAKVIAEQSRRKAQHAPPEETWKYIAGIFGMPVMEDREMLHGPPGATWFLAAFVTLVSCVAFFHPRDWVATFGLIPAQAMRYGGLTVLTSFFLHGSIWHLAANIYFLLLFGDNIEETIGVGRYLLLISLATVAGALVHIMYDPRQNVPVIGASAGIAGIVAFYAFQFPRVSLKFFLFNWMAQPPSMWVTIPAWAFFALWIGLQILGVVYEISGFSNVSALGHVGGAAVGILFSLEWRLNEWWRRGDSNP